MKQYNFLPFPVLKSNNITLRQLTANDDEAILDLRGNKVAMQYVPRPLMQNIEEAKGFINLLDTKLQNGEGINWAICLNDNLDTLIGNICHFNFKMEANRSEVGYMLHPNYFRQGIMSDALRLVLEYGFEIMKFHSVEAIIIEENIASRKVAEKAGFLQEGLLRESSYHNNQYWNQCIYSMLKKDFKL